MVAPLVIAAVASAVLGGGQKYFAKKKEEKLLQARGKAIQQYYEDQETANRIVTARTSRKAIGTSVAQAGAENVDYSGSTMGAAFDQLFDFQFQEAVKRSELNSQGILGKGGQEFSAAEAGAGAAAAPIETANTIFDGLKNGGVKTTDTGGTATAVKK
jgi:type II secretory pathway pseudopilin PulG